MENGVEQPDSCGVLIVLREFTNGSYTSNNGYKVAVLSLDLACVTVRFNENKANQQVKMSAYYFSISS